MVSEKPEKMGVSKRYDENYWYGYRKYVYGGYKYIPGRWAGVAATLIKEYKLENNSKVLDIGCGKGFLMYEIKKLLPDISVSGIDISEYAIKKSKEEVSQYISAYNMANRLPFLDQSFDLVVSVGAFHNLKINELSIALPEMNRVGKNKYLMLESFRNERELFNLQCWALTATSFHDSEEWVWIYKNFGYDGDYEFIYFE